MLRSRTRNNLIFDCILEFYQFGHENTYFRLAKQLLNVKSSTEIEQAGTTNSFGNILWTHHVLLDIGYSIYTK